MAVEEGTDAESVDTRSITPALLLETVRRHRVTDVLSAHLDRLDLPGEVVDQLAVWRGRARPLLMVQTLEATRAAALLAAAGVDALAIKGVALAVLTTGRVDARGAGDVDVLIRPEDLATAHRVLTEAGWSLAAGGRVEPHTWAFRHVERWGSALTYRGDGADIDLHWRLEVTPGAFPAMDELWSRRAEVALGSGTVATMSAYDALRHSAGHREGWYFLRTLVDLRRLARTDGVFDGPLRPLAVTSLALARATVGLPAAVPSDVHDQLDRAPSKLLARAWSWHLAEIPRGFDGGAGSLGAFRIRLAAGAGVVDLQHTLVALVLPAHAAMPVRSRTAWTGIPTALTRRALAFVRAITRRFRRGAPCAARPERAA
jgi:hypothetical protein